MRHREVKEWTWFKVMLEGHIARDQMAKRPEVNATGSQGGVAAENHFGPPRNLNGSNYAGNRSTYVCVCD
jgi:hypothetical protein